jgi:hypothetical protein
VFSVVLKEVVDCQGQKVCVVWARNEMQAWKVEDEDEKVVSWVWRLNIVKEDNKVLYNKLQVKGWQVQRTNKKYTNKLQLVRNEGMGKGSRWSAIIHSNNMMELLRMLLGMPLHFWPKKFFKLKWLDCISGVIWWGESVLIASMYVRADVSLTN